MIIYPDPSGGEKGDGVRPPPQPPVTVRTMDSDITSMQNSGGGAPEEVILNAPRPPIRQEPPKFPNNDVTVKIPGYTGPEKSVFPTGSFLSEETPEPPAMILSQNKEQSFGGGSVKKIIALIVVIIAAVGVGAGFYFVVFPKLLGPISTPTPTGEPTPAPTVSPTPITSSPGASSHVSFIKAAQVDASALTEVPIETVTTGQTLTKEILLKKNGVSVKLSEYFPTLIPEFSARDLQNFFDEDFTTFIYYNASGSWPGYIFKLKTGAASVVAQNSFRKIESSKSIKNLFLNGAGDQQEQFKNGGYKDVNTHYLLFGNNTAINYGWVGNYLLITTNFQSLKDLIDGGLIKTDANNNIVSSPLPSPKTSTSTSAN
ncbi:MAG: hypothetical protein Q8L47_01005 [bacterium]|nr:hypothetical protein [bacterium]